MKETKPVFLVVKRRAIFAALTVFICMFLGVIGAFQYANYVDMRSNQRWCEIVILFNESYKENPPTTATGAEIARAMLNLSKEFKCA
jgi:hypothetical protein